MAKLYIYLLIISFLSLSLPTNSTNPYPNSVYDELENSGFPRGLLPSNIKSYTVNSTTGKFAVELDTTCQFTLPKLKYLAAYSPKITGKLMDRRISSLNGIRVRALFRWWSVSGIRSNGENLVFEVGTASGNYPARHFAVSPRCHGSARSAAL